MPGLPISKSQLDKLGPMKHYLLIFDRLRGELLTEKEFGDRSSALKARFEAERERPSASAVEIVILGAESSSALRRTHARYFQTARELARTGFTGLSPTR